MNSFDFQNRTRIIFGRDVEQQAGSLMAGLGKTVLLHYGGGSIKKSGLYQRIMKSLMYAGVEVVELPGAMPNPRLSLVREGISLCRSRKVDAILAVGGGSVIDSAKAIGIGVKYQGDVWDFFSGNAAPESMLPLGVVLTIPAAGSEASSFSVITNEDGWLKMGTGNDCMRPEFALMNPELTFSLPPFQTACGISDMLAHVMERYFSNTPDVELTDRLCEATMQTILHLGPVVVREPENYGARAEILWTGTVAHNGWLDPGRETDWASHAIEHELSALYDIAHGAGLSIVFPAWMKTVYPANPVRFARFASRVMGIEYNFDNPEETILLGIEALERFYRLLGLPVRMSDLKIPDDRIPEMARRATAQDAMPLGNLKKLLSADVEKILRLAAR